MSACTVNDVDWILKKLHVLIRDDWFRVLTDSGVTISEACRGLERAAKASVSTFTPEEFVELCRGD